MNKYINLLIVLVLVVSGGIAYKTLLVKEEDKPIVTGKVKEFNMRIVKDEWRFEPDNIEANQGDKIILHITNEDDYDHGISIEAFGVSQRISANEKITIDFVVTKAGDFPFYCSVPCGEGEVGGEHRGHFDQVGKIHVKSQVNVTE